MLLLPLILMAAGSVAVKANDGRTVPATWTPAASSPVPRGSGPVTAASEASPVPRGSGPAPAMLLVAEGGSRADWAPVATRLAAAGIGALTIELRPSPGDPAESASDLLGALAWLRKQPAVDPAHIIVAATGDASLTALAAAASDPKVAGLALVSPPLKRGDFDGAVVLVTYGERPFLVVVGKGDKPAAKAALVLDGNAQGPHKIHIARIGGRGARLLADDTGDPYPDGTLRTMEAFLGWAREISGVKPEAGAESPGPKPKPTCPDASKCG